MSTLQISLAIVGGLVLAGVVAYNAWVTRRSAPRTARGLPEADLSHDDAGADTVPVGDTRVARISPRYVCVNCTPIFTSVTCAFAATVKLRTIGLVQVVAVSLIVPGAVLL